MTTYVELLAGDDSQDIPSGVQLDIPYALIGPDGTRVVFNDQSDVDYVGVLSSISGLDMAEVRESADNRVQTDGGLHGDFFLGRRTVTLEGLVLNPLNENDRNRKITKIKRAALALRQDATLQWTYSSGVTQYIPVRVQSPLRIEGAWQKRFFLSLVCADHRIFGIERKIHVHNPSTTTGTLAEVGTFAINNNGSIATSTMVSIEGLIGDFQIANMSTGTIFRFAGEVSEGETLYLESSFRTCVSDALGSRYSETLVGTSEWLELAPGRNEIAVYAVTSSNDSASIKIEWRDAWI